MCKLTSIWVWLKYFGRLLVDCRLLEIPKISFTKLYSIYRNDGDIGQLGERLFLGKYGELTRKRKFSVLYWLQCISYISIKCGHAHAKSVVLFNHGAHYVPRSGPPPPRVHPLFDPLPRNMSRSSGFSHGKHYLYPFQAQLWKMK